MDFKLIGSPCGQHGPYTFYKAFKYSKNGKPNILAISEFFFVKLWNDSDLVSIGELQLLWEDKTSEQTLASVRLYILPENTPEGRNYIHGEVCTTTISFVFSSYVWYSSYLTCLIDLKFLNFTLPEFYLEKVGNLKSAVWLRMFLVLPHQ